MRRAIGALPENNGAARRAVYEKARTALVGQLRAITPPLPAREITQHRLQLEDCIREVEQEASEAVIKLGRAQQPAMRRLDTSPIAPSRPAPPPPPVEEPQPVAQAPEPVVEEEPPVETEPPAKAEPPIAAEPPPSAAAEDEAAAGQSIEDIIAAAEADTAPQAEEPDQPAEAEAEPLPESKVVELDSRKLEPPPVGEPPEAEEPVGTEEPEKNEKPGKPAEEPLPARPGLRLFTSNRKAEPAPDPAPRAPAVETRSEPFRIAAIAGDTPAAASGRVETTMGGQAAARKSAPDFEPLVVVEDQPVEAALSSVREVEVEPADNSETREAEGAISRAIETLDRAARGEALPEPEAAAASEPAAETRRERSDLAADREDADFEPAVEGRASSGLTIFLVVFALLLAGAGGGGYWAWREGYIDLDQMFGRSTATAQAQPAEQPSPADGGPTAGNDPAQPAPELTGPGNTATETAAAEPATALQGIVNEDRLEPTPEPEVPSADEEGPAAEDPLADERLPSSDGDVALADDPSASVDPAVLAGSQSLLLEASDDGRTGAVPFSGTVEWSRGVDEVGMPTLIAQANIPARNLGVEVTIRRNADPSLPASHLMEIDFDVADTFAGGGISSLPGVLLKNEELAQGQQLVGASARVVGNSFLFALSASEQDAVTNRSLLGSRKWMDLAVIYATGKRAIITLEKDDEAESLFTEVLAEWDSAGN
ncbi:hypothetical protein VE25_06510 [Devosia geojensis]|uniref:Uncharacterized protein n=1 Tax=Devosia geojensis TaxID=443610 RepID=A0A0F5FWN4_9HYPH|nr:hypothetical protein VE25_06510 [Devosia geojensis]